MTRTKSRSFPLIIWSEIKMTMDEYKENKKLLEVDLGKSRRSRPKSISGNTTNAGTDVGEKVKGGGQPPGARCL